MKIRKIRRRCLRSQTYAEVSHFTLLLCRGRLIKALLHRRFLSQQLDAIFVALKLQLQNRTCKPGAILTAICRRDIAGVSNMFET